MTKQKTGLLQIRLYQNKMDVRVRQRDMTDCGAACLASVFRYYNKDIPIARIRQKAGTDRKGTNILGMIEASESFGFEAKGVKGPFESLSAIPLPAIAHVVVHDTLQHFIVILKVTKRFVRIMDPADGEVRKVSHELFKRQWAGVLILLLPGENFKLLSKEDRSVAGRLRALLRPHKSILLQALFGALVYTVVGLSTSVFIQKIVDFVIADSNYRLLHLMSMAMVILLLLRLFVGTFKDIFIIKTGQMIDARLILGYYKHILRLPQQFFDTMRVGEITSRIGDAVKIRVFINDIAINLVVNVFMLLFSFVLMFTYYWKLALIMFLIVPVYSVIYIITNRWNKKVQRDLMEDGAELESQLVESLNAVGTIKRFGIEEYSNLKTEGSFIKLLRTVYKSGMNSLFSGTSTELASQLFTIILLWTGATFVLENKITPGELLSFYTLIGYFTGPVSSFIGLNKTVQDALIAADRLFEIMDLELDSQTGDQIEIDIENHGNIRIDGLTFGYGTRTTVFENLSLEIEAGKMTGIVGSSGSGKSTLISLLHKIYPFQGGGIFIGEYSLRHIGHASLKRLIGVVPQQIDLFSGDIIDNIALGDDNPDMQRVIDLCARLGLSKYIEGLPQTYRTNIGQNGVMLSGGQRQRIAIARALYRQPAILILDEATSSLDTLSEHHIQAVLDEFVDSGKTVIVIAHRLSSVQRADKIIVLKDGMLAEQGTHVELMMLRSEYYSLWNQFLPAEPPTA